MKKTGNNMIDMWESAMPKLSGVHGPVIVSSTPDETVLSYRDVICRWNWKPIKITLNWDDLPSANCGNIC